MVNERRKRIGQHGGSGKATERARPRNERVAPAPLPSLGWAVHETAGAWAAAIIVRASRADGPSPYPSPLDEGRGTNKVWGEAAGPDSRIAEARVPRLSEQMRCAERRSRTV